LHVSGSKPEVVLFDAGGTLVLIDPERFNAFLAAWSVPAVEAGRLNDAHYQAMSEYADGLAAGDDLEFGWWVARFFDLVGLALSSEMADAFGGGRGMWNHPIPGARQAVRTIQARGYRVAVVSNSDGTVAEALALAGFAGTFEVIIDSSNVGISKPDPGIFEMALQSLEVPAASAWYVGDSHYHDMGGARAAGLAVGVLIDPLALGPPGHVAVRSIGELPGLLA
jgi:putative hydrolase of the HAD superfamily